MQSIQRLPQAGFSLLDLVVAISILGLMFAISLPAFGRLGERHVLVAETARLRALLERLSANSEIYEEDFVLALKKDSYFLHQKGSDKVIHSRQLQKPISVDLDNDKPIEITFHKGRSSTPLSLELKGTNIFCKLTLSLRGRVTEQC